MIKNLYRLSQVAIVVTAVVIILGAYTRLTDAGLGCPDWPGCYGFLTVPTEVSDISEAEQAFPERPVEAHKAWNEMIHRYFAGSLGLIILAIFIMSLKARLPMLLPSVLLATVCFQAALGMWTVTMNLQPAVVMGHLLGGFTTFSLLLLMTLQLRQKIKASWIPKLELKVRPSLIIGFKLATVVLVLQIALGGWTASNYAAVACIELPVCESGWQERFDLKQALSIPTGHADYEFGVFPYEARMTIHILHRFGALFTTLILVGLIWKLFSYRQAASNKMAWSLSGFLTLQVLLGLSNVVFHLPLAVAVAHNFVAACLLLTLLTSWFICQKKFVMGLDELNQGQTSSTFSNATQGV